MRFPRVRQYDVMYRIRLPHSDITYFILYNRFFFFLQFSRARHKKLSPKSPFILRTSSTADCDPMAAPRTLKNDIPQSWISRTVACDYICIVFMLMYRYILYLRHFFTRRRSSFMLLSLRVYFIIIVRARAPRRR